MYQGCQKLHIQLSDDRYEFIQPSKELHLLFPKKQMPLTDASMCAETLAEAPEVTFAFSGKSKCHSQMTDESRNISRGPQESHLLFPEKANATHR